MELFNLKLIMTVYVIYILGVIGDEVNHDEQLDGSEVNLEEPQGEKESSKDTKTGRINSKAFSNRANDAEQLRSIIPGKCNSIIETYEGNVNYMFSDSFSGNTKCDITYKSPVGTTLNAFCPVVDLDERGCSQESLTLKSSKANSIMGCKSRGELNLIGTTNELKLKHRRKDSSSSTAVKGYFCMISIQSEFKSGIANTMVSINNDQIGYIVSDGTMDYTQYSFLFQSPSRSTLQIVCPMVELNADGCNEERLIFVDTGYESNSITVCQVSCKSSLSTTSNDLEVIYRGIKGSENVRGIYCIVVANEEFTTTTSTTTSSTTSSTTSTTTTTTTTSSTSTTTTSATTSTTTSTTSSTTTATTTTACIPSPCSSSASFLLSEVIVTLCLEEVTYHQAKCTCDSIGQGLYSPDTEEKFDEYLMALEDHGLSCTDNNHVWAPFTDEIWEGTFRWDSTDEIVIHGDDEDPIASIATSGDEDCAYYNCDNAFSASLCSDVQTGYICLIR